MIHKYHANSTTDILSGGEDFRSGILISDAP